MSNLDYDERMLYRILLEDVMSASQGNDNERCDEPVERLSIFEKHYNITLTFNPDATYQSLAPARARTARRPGVYVVGIGGVVKIGYSFDIPKRLATIQTSCPLKIDLLLELPDAQKETEQRLHETFQHLRTHGEWFDFGDHNPVLAVTSAMHDWRTCNVT